MAMNSECKLCSVEAKNVRLCVKGLRETTEIRLWDKIRIRNLPNTMSALQILFR
jgi:hypothetical protein